jgi:hypothetical protein
MYALKVDNQQIYKFLTFMEPCSSLQFSKRPETGCLTLPLASRGPGVAQSV